MASQSDTMEPLIDTNKMHINGFLCYATHALRSGTPNFLKNIIKAHFSIRDIIAGKNLLWQECRDTIGYTFPIRQKSTHRPAYEAHLDDVIDAIKMVDAVDKLPIFVARDLSKLPNLQPEELNQLLLYQQGCRFRGEYKTTPR